MDDHLHIVESQAQHRPAPQQPCQVLSTGLRLRRQEGQSQRGHLAHVGAEVARITQHGGLGGGQATETRQTEFHPWAEPTETCIRSKLCCQQFLNDSQLLESIGNGENNKSGKSANDTHVCCSALY
jgi:hypothetical protein